MMLSAFAFRILIIVHSDKHDPTAEAFQLSIIAVVVYLLNCGIRRLVIFKFYEQGRFINSLSRNESIICKPFSSRQFTEYLVIILCCVICQKNRAAQRVLIIVFQAGCDGNAPSLRSAASRVANCRSLRDGRRSGLMREFQSFCHGLCIAPNCCIQQIIRL